MNIKDDFIEDWQWALPTGQCGLDNDKTVQANMDYYIACLRLGLSFLRQNFEAPEGCQFGLLWFHYIGWFPSIGFASDGDRENIPLGAHEQAYQMEKAIEVFNSSVDWQALFDCINEFGKK